MWPNLDKQVIMPLFPISVHNVNQIKLMNGKSERHKPALTRNQPTREIGNWWLWTEFKYF